MKRILGVDPGSRLTGYGCVEKIDSKRIRHIGHGTLRVSNTSGKQTQSLESRLLSIYEGLAAVILEYKPQIMVIEKVFFAKNALSALSLGQARGVAILTGKIHSLEIVEYSATQVKQALTGHGHASKEQVAKMIQVLLGKQTFTTFDSSDGLALAVCHANQSEYSLALQSSSIRRNKKTLSLAEAVGAKALSKRP